MDGKIFEDYPLIILMCLSVIACIGLGELLATVTQIHALTYAPAVIWFLFVIIMLLKNYDKKLKQFLLNQRAVHNKLIEDVWNKDKDFKAHKYTQWLFPITEPSVLHPFAPHITNIGYFKQDREEFEFIQDSISTSLGVIAYNYGFNYHSTGKPTDPCAFVKLDNFDTYKTRWLVKRTPEHRKISRILKCLMLFDLKDTAKKFYEALITTEHATEIINKTSLSIWADIVNGKDN